MKIKSIIFAIFILTTFQLKAQDKIITNNNDTINCEIISIENNLIRYAISIRHSIPKTENKLLLKNMSLPAIKEC
ncbi:MAG: hypothetical protein LBV69_00615 [Bacteroidales bacterium]|jgi:hypothetical protein|nr:hypothetical protein [Bacteroidales bacterium]